MSTPLSIHTNKIVLIATLTISNGGTDSGVSDADAYGPFEAITIIAPATLPETITVQVGDTDAAAPNFAALQSPPGTDVTVAAGKAITIFPPCFPQFRMHAGGPVGADRVFKVWARRNSTSSA